MRVCVHSYVSVKVYYVVLIVRYVSLQDVWQERSAKDAPNDKLQEIDYKFTWQTHTHTVTHTHAGLLINTHTVILLKIHTHMYTHTKL